MSSTPGTKKRSRKSSRKKSSKGGAVGGVRKGASKNKGSKMKVVDDLIMDMSNFSSSTQLLEKRKELLEVQRELENTRKDVNQTLAKIAENENELAAKRKELTNNIIALDKFIVENERRKNKAIENKKKEEEELKKCVAQISDTDQHIADLEDEFERKQSDLNNNYRQYYDYLRSVVVQRFAQASSEDVKQLMKKHENLERTHTQLTEFVKKKEEEVNIELKKLKTYVETAKNDQIKLDNKIARLTRDYDDEKFSTQTLQKEFDNYMSKLSKIKVTEGQIQMACQYLYNRVVSAVKNFQRKSINIQIAANKKDGSPNSVEELKHKKTMEMLKIIRTHVQSFVEIGKLIDETKNKGKKKKKRKTMKVESEYKREW